MTRARRSVWLTVMVVWAAAGAATLPVIVRWAAPPASAVRTHIAIDLSYAAAGLLCFVFARREAAELGWKPAIGIAVLVLVLAAVTNQIHSFNVDQASNYAPPLSNEALQVQLQAQVVQLSPGAVPHSYRFLPNALVYWLQLGGIRYDAARDIYRLLTGLLLFYAIYRFARLYVDVRGAVIALLLVCAIYPVSFEWYIGQLTDPLSHLSFVLAFIFLETENFLLLMTTLLVGSLAKETVLALCGFYLLFQRGPAKRPWRGVLLCCMCLAFFFAVRMFVLHGAMHYEQISGPGPRHVIENWRDSKWQKLFAWTGGAYLPFVVLGWRQAPILLKHLLLFLIPVLFISSLFFSWLSETRNWMPVVFVSAVIAAKFWSDTANRIGSKRQAA